MQLARIRTLVFLVPLMGIVLFLVLQGNQPSSAMNPQSELTAPYGHRGSWELIFGDDFDSQNVDPNKWVLCYWWNNNGCTNEGNSELQWYLPGNVSIENGTLRLTAAQETVDASDGRTYDYTSGMVTTGRVTSNTETPARLVYKYGYAEVRARVPKGQGLWPAVWLLPAEQNSKPEIDVMEVLGHQPNIVHMNFHYTNPDGSRGRSAHQWTSDEDLSEDWHTYAVDWKPNEIVWYVDGIEHRRFTDMEFIPSEPMYLIMNLAVGGDWAGDPDSETVFPSAFEVDYVRVWKRGGNVVLSPTSDTYVDATNAEANFGGSESLSIDGDPVHIAYLSYDLSALRGKTISSVWLRVKTTTHPSAGSENTQTVHLVPRSDWREANLNYQDELPFDQNSLGLLSGTQPGIFYDIPLDMQTIQDHAGKTLSIAIQTPQYDGIYIYSREFQAIGPRLFINFEQESSNTSSFFTRIWNALGQ